MPACATSSRWPVRAIFPLVLWGVLAGCARYEFDVVEPPQFAQHVGSQGDAVVQISPLSYRMRVAENHLVIQIFNSGPDALTLSGAESFVVDAGGQSHRLAQRVLAPNSFVKLILPPMEPERAPAGPVVSFGLGTGVGAGTGVGMGVGDAVGGSRAYPGAGDEAWDWSGETDVRLSLTYRPGQGPPFTHAFLLHRRKV